MPNHIRHDAYLFGEAQGRIIVSVNPGKKSEFELLLQNTPFEFLGEVTNGSLKVGDANWGDIDTWKKIYDEAIENMLLN
jgi:phosphoribosylformylglycinamidine synthase